MLRKISIVTKLVLIIATFSVIIFRITLGYNYYHSQALLQAELESNARNLAASLVNRVEAELVSVTKVAEGVVRSLETVPYNEQTMRSLLNATVIENKEIYGAAIAFEPYAYQSDKKFYAPYYYRDGTEIKFSRLEDSYQHSPYIYWDWYQIPKELHQTEWSEPYFDEGASNLLVSTYSVPFYENSSDRRKFKGVVTSDISLDALTNIISSVKILDTGYAALLSRNGMILAHPLKDAIMNETFFSIAETRNDPAMRELGRKMVRGESGFVLYKSMVGIKSWMYYAPIRSTGWTLAVVFPEQELLKNTRRLTFTMATMGFIGITLLILAVVYIAKLIIRPLRTLAVAADEIATGNFDIALPKIDSGDEVGQLTQDFELMRKSLKDYIRNLTETTAAKERIQSELKVATNIQASLLPRIFPAFPTHHEFDVFASMVPAKEVGGDFYDFFFIDNQSLCFLIADVSDKGVPAALYMMVAKTLLKSEGQRLKEPAKILESVNRTLAMDNDACMFATVFLAILDTSTGQLLFSNAGHNPPLLMSAHGAHYLTMQPGLMIGPIEDTVYKTESIMLQPGDTLLLYTDGVTEAKNLQDQLYSESQLQTAFQRVANADLKEIISYISDDVAKHANTAPQSDDITMLVLRIKHLN
jgi:sigma-B regulation protein RsbU (phosphoserine phosphatase)